MIKAKLFLIFLFLGIVNLYSKVFITPEEALKDAFGNCIIEKKRIYLTENDATILEKELGFKIKHRFYSFYIAKDHKNVSGYALLQTDVVRTKEMSLMVILNPDYSIKNLYLISFYEPIEYKPSERWLKLFINKNKNDPLVPGIDLPVVSGATLTSRTVSNMVRLTLKLAKYLE
jgi:Na+-translocating ferredoxin:NAD+ oxidoreductase RnfG subunit